VIELAVSERAYWRSTTPSLITCDSNQGT